MFVYFVNGIDWIEGPLDQARSRSRVNNASPGHRGSGSDCFLYDPYLKTCFDVDTTYARGNFPWKHSEDLPTGFVYLIECILAPLIASQDEAV